MVVSFYLKALNFFLCPNPKIEYNIFTVVGMVRIGNIWNKHSTTTVLFYQAISKSYKYI